MDSEEIERVIALLETIVDDRGKLAALAPELRRRLVVAAGRVSRPERDEVRKLAKALRRKERDARRAADEARRDSTGIRALRKMPVFQTPPPPRSLPSGEAAREAAATAAGPELEQPRKCYVCKREYRRLHHFYDQLCPDCGDFNFAKREQTADLRGRVAIVTGARVKIGYQAAIMLLRAGARVIVTTRFPRDAAERYAREADFDAWRDRLSVYGLDLRHTPSVERFAAHLVDTLDRLDFIVHNACQTVRRPPGFYAHLLELETQPTGELPAATRPLLAAWDDLRSRTRGARLAAGLRDPAALSQAALTAEDHQLGSGTEIFPDGRLDADLQQVDLRDVNSWRLALADVPTIELLEVHLVNAVAPFVLSARLKPLMLRVATRDKHIVNVSAMEGQFYREFKTDRHPHTNMAKAALNMLTRTSAADYVRDGIHMNSVDTGWVTDEDPVAIASRKAEEHRFSPPLDIVDGAARIVDPIFRGIRDGEHLWGLFLKDYFPTDW